MSKKVLVTGGAGFIGSHLVERLLKAGNQVVVIDNLITGAEENLAGLKGNLEVMKADIEQPLEIQGLDEIYNLASPASPVAYRDHPLETLKVGAMGIWNVLELVRENGAKFLHTSTSEVYGDPLEHPQKETYYGNVNPVGPRSCYDESKRFAESLIINYAQKYGLALKIARVFNTYGPKMQLDDGRVMPNFINQALKNEGITVYGDGSQTRSFCYVDDLVDGIIKLMEVSDFDGPVNLGNPQETKVIDLAKRIIELISSESKIIHRELPQDDPLQRCPDLTLAKIHLGFEPKIGLEEGLKNTIEYFKNKTI